MYYYINSLTSIQNLSAPVLSPIKFLSGLLSTNFLPSIRRLLGQSLKQKKKHGHSPRKRVRKVFPKSTADYVVANKQTSSYATFHREPPGSGSIAERSFRIRPQGTFGIRNLLVCVKKAYRSECISLARLETTVRMVSVRERGLRQT